MGELWIDFLLVAPIVPALYERTAVQPYSHTPHMATLHGRTVMLTF